MRSWIIVTRCQPCGVPSHALPLHRLASRIFVVSMAVGAVHVRLTYAPPAAAGDKEPMPAGAQLPAMVQFLLHSVSLRDARVHVRSYSLEQAIVSREQLLTLLGDHFAAEGRAQV